MVVMIDEEEEDGKTICIHVCIVLES